MNSISVVIITEKDRLENQSRMLIDFIESGKKPIGKSICLLTQSIYFDINHGSIFHLPILSIF